MFSNISLFLVIITKWERNEFIFPSSTSIPNSPPPDSSIPYKHYHSNRPLASSVWAAISKYQELGVHLSQFCSWKSKIKAPVALVSGENQLPVHREPPLTVSQEEGRGLSLGSLLWGTDRILCPKLDTAQKSIRKWLDKYVVGHSYYVNTTRHLYTGMND